MKNLKLYENFDLDEAKTLFGDSISDRLKTTKKFAEDKGWQTELSSGGLGIPAEVKELWGNIKTERGFSHLDVLRIWGKFAPGFEKVNEITKAVANMIVSGEKEWETSGIKMIGRTTEYHKKSENQAITMHKAGLGQVTVETRLLDGRQKNEGKDFIVFVSGLKEDRKPHGNISPGLADKIEDFMSGLSKKEKLEAIRFMKDRYTEFTDSI